jgi:hypothetical protein
LLAIIVLSTPDVLLLVLLLVAPVVVVGEIALMIGP